MTRKSSVPSASEVSTEIPAAAADIPGRSVAASTATTKPRRSAVVVAVLVVLVFIATAGYGWYRYYLARYAPTAVAKPVTQVKATDPYADWQTYTSSADHFSVQYPSSWVLDTQDAPSQEVGYDAATLTSPSNTVLNLYANTGGHGGLCRPFTQDVPFHKGNQCTTLEYLTAEQLPMSNLYYLAEVPNTSPVKYVPQPATVYLVTTHFADQTGTSSYGISLAETTTPKNSFALNTPYMGMNVSYTWLTPVNAQGQGLPYVYVYANGSSPSFLTSSDVATIKAILRTFRLTI